VNLPKVPQELRGIKSRKKSNPPKKGTQNLPSKKGRREKVEKVFKTLSNPWEKLKFPLKKGPRIPKEALSFLPLTQLGTVILIRFPFKPRKLNGSQKKEVFKKKCLGLENVPPGLSSP